MAFQFPLNISNHPCSWGVDYAECPTNPPWEKVIKCIAESGYAGTELGPVGYYDPEKLGEKLESLKLQLVAGNIFEKLHEPAEVKAILEKVHTSCRTLKKFGAKYFVIVPHVCDEKIATAGRPADAPRLPDSQWKPFMDAIKQVAEITKSYGIQCTLHPHAGCWIEYEDEIERALADLPADLVGLCLDTGHFTYAGMDPVAKYKKYAARVPYMHFKDIDGTVLAMLQKEKKGFWDGIKSGVFCPLGKGLVDFPGVLRAMKEHGFSGWVTVEQDADNSISDEQARLMKPFEACKLNVQYLRSLGVVKPEVLDVAVVACGAPKRGMGWYHAKQLLDGRVQGARLTDIVEPFFLAAGKDSPPGKDFAAWAEGAASGVSMHKSIGDMPKPAGRKLAIICGRTADNPKLFREAVDHGFSHVYLEKPGAPTVAELEEMAAYAKAKGVPVYMGFNRNFSKYVRLAQDSMATAPAGATFTLGRNDCFNTPESLDECFERNAEGMLKNMMIHEIVVLISYFGLKVSSVKEIVSDKGYTCIETRKGFTDLSKMACTIKTNEGREFKLWGDRSNGEYGEAVVAAGGKELFKAVRPDTEISDTAVALEKADPGCMPYFYLQDGEYLALKAQVVQHVASGKPGSPQGVADVETAIEGLKLCDCITESLMSKRAADGEGAHDAKRQRVGM